MPRTKARDAAEKLRIEARRVQAAEMYLKGTRNLTKIAAALGVDKSLISLDFKVIRGWWRERYAEDYHNAILIESERLSLIQEEAFAAWERSKQPREITSQEKTTEQSFTAGDGAAGESSEKPKAGPRKEQREGNSEKLKVGLRKEHREGNPKFLEIVRECIKDRLALFGLKPADKLHVSTPPGEALKVEHADRIDVNRITDLAHLEMLRELRARYCAPPSPN